MEDLSFPAEKLGIHHHDICDASCTFSREEISRQLEANKDKKKEKLFNHTWLCKADIAYYTESGYWWHVFAEGELSYAHIKGSIGYAKDQLNQLTEGPKKAEFIKNLTGDLKDGPCLLLLYSSHNQTNSDWPT